MDTAASDKVGLVIIGRNEGERLRRCFLSTDTIDDRVYVDSGSSDGSAELARSAGVEVVELRMPPPFTAARARNAGLGRLLQRRPELQFVQMLDGDCEMQPGWISSASAALQADARLALVFGRRRERFPDRSLYNALCDDEWNVPLGEAAGCGGDALFRVDALRAVNFYNPRMIAGEDSELSMRMRKAGWLLERIDVEMTLHDAAMTRFGQWWRRTKRSGHAFAEMARLHPDARHPNWPRTVKSIAIWGGLFPATLAVTAALALWVKTDWCLAVGLLLSAWSVKVVRLALTQRRRGLSRRVARASGILLMLGKMPQFLGLVGYHYDRIIGRASRLIEYH